MNSKVYYADKTTFCSSNKMSFFLFFFPFKRINIVRGFFMSLTFCNFLLCSCFRSQTLVVGTCTGGTNCSITRHDNGGRATIWRVVRLSSDARVIRLWFQVVFLQRDSNGISTWFFASWYLFRLCRFLLSRFNKHSHGNRISSVGRDSTKFLKLRENTRNSRRVAKF